MRLIARSYGTFAGSPPWLRAGPIGSRRGGDACGGSRPGSTGPRERGPKGSCGREGRETPCPRKREAREALPQDGRDWPHDCRHPRGFPSQDLGRDQRGPRDRGGGGSGGEGHFPPRPGGRRRGPAATGGRERSLPDDPASGTGRVPCGAGMEAGLPGRRPARADPSSASRKAPPAAMPRRATAGRRPDPDAWDAVTGTAPTRPARRTSWRPGRPPQCPGRPGRPRPALIRVPREGTREPVPRARPGIPVLQGGEDVSSMPSPVFRDLQARRFSPAPARAR
jgi:hypothetical protein